MNDRLKATAPNGSPSRPGEGAPPSNPSWQAFLDQVARVNPFLDNRVVGPAPPETDVATIHTEAFEQLTTVAEETLRARRGIGAVLAGETGVGKSHLLARLGRWARDRAVFVHLRDFQVDPETLPFTFLHLVIHALTRGRRVQFIGTPLYQLVRAGVLEAVGQDARFHSWKALGRAYQSWVDRFIAAGGPGSTGMARVAFDLLFTLFRSSTRAAQSKEDGKAAVLAGRWLSGQPLDPADARLVGLPLTRRRDEPVALEDATQVKQIFVALSALASAWSRPFILVLDQVENLQANQIAALVRFLESLLDSSPDLLIVTTGLPSSLKDWRERGVVSSSAWDRLAQFEVLLPRVDRAGAQAILLQRLAAFRQPWLGCPGLEQASTADPWFPLSASLAAAWFDGKSELCPREALNAAREAWRQEQERLRQRGSAGWLADHAILLEPSPPREPPLAAGPMSSPRQERSESMPREQQVASEPALPDLLASARVPGRALEETRGGGTPAVEDLVQPSAPGAAEGGFEIFAAAASTAEEESVLEEEEMAILEAGDDLLEEAPPPEVAGPPDESAFDGAVRNWITNHVDQREEQPGTLPPDADRMAVLLCELLQGCKEAGLYGVIEVQRLPVARTGIQPPFQFVATLRPEGRDRASKTGVVLLTQAGSLAVTASLARVREDSRSHDRIILVTEERVGLPLGARGQEHLDDLRLKGWESFCEIALTFREHAQLDALQAVIWEAGSGNLVATQPGRSSHVLTPGEVIASHHRQGRYLAHRLLKELLTASEANSLDAFEVLQS